MRMRMQGLQQFALMSLRCTLQPMQRVGGDGGRALFGCPYQQFRRIRRRSNFFFDSVGKTKKQRINAPGINDEQRR